MVYRVKEYGGLAVLDWHTESSCNFLEFNNYLTIFKEILVPFIDDSEVWFATP